MGIFAMHFDARAAKLLVPGKHLVIEGCPGLRLVASASRKTWIYRYKSISDGLMKQVAIGQWPATSVQVAGAKWQTLRDQRDQGVDLGQERRDKRLAAKVAATKEYTVRRLVVDYVAGHLMHNRKEAGALLAEQALIRLLNDFPMLAERAAASITRADAFATIEARKDKPTSAAKLRSLLGAAWDYALDAGRIDGNVPNWWRVVMKGRLKSKGKTLNGKYVGQQRRALRDIEVATMLAWLPNMHMLGSDTFVMYLWTCCRGAEILSMRPEHIQQEADGWWWKIPRELTKNARFEQALDLRVPLVGRALEVVQRRLASAGKSGWLFEGRGDKCYQQRDFCHYIYRMQPYSSRVNQRVADGLVLPVANWTPHNLRRTSKTFLAELGCPNEIAEAILGNILDEIVGTYNVHSYDPERRAWMNKLAVYLEALAIGGYPEFCVNGT